MVTPNGRRAPRSWTGPGAAAVARPAPAGEVDGPHGFGQVGCVYTAQGFEFDYVGVIFGPDLVYRPMKGWVGQREESQDRVVRRLHAEMAEHGLVGGLLLAARYQHLDRADRQASHRPERTLTT